MDEQATLPSKPAGFASCVNWDDHLHETYQEFRARAEPKGRTPQRCPVIAALADRALDQGGPDQGTANAR
ncbi:MAG: hypothetical protein P4L86_11635 [Mycobacterium sp.]|nr:hypothetical protein [Mycobacterium sp.]